MPQPKILGPTKIKAFDRGNWRLKNLHLWMNGSHPQNFSRPNSRPFSFRPKKKRARFVSWDLEFCMFLQVFSWDLPVFHGTCLCCSSCCLFVGHFEFNSLPPLAFLEIKFDLFSQEGGSKNSIHIQPLRKSAKIGWLSGLIFFTSWPVAWRLWQLC